MAVSKFLESLRGRFIGALVAVLVLTCGAGSALANVDVVVNVSDNPDPAIAGAALTYTVTANNNGSDSTTGNVALSVSLPASAVFVSASPSDGTSCTGPVAGVLSCTLNNIAAGATTTIPVIVRPQVIGTNSLSATTTTAGDSNTANNTSITQPTTVFAGANLAISVAASVDPVTPGVQFAYTVGVNNAGPQATNGTVTVTNNLPAGVTYVGASGTGWTCAHSSGVVTCTSTTSIANGANGADITITAVPFAAGGSTLIDAATVSLAPASVSDATDPDSSNNTGSRSVTVSPGTDMGVSISASPTNPLAGNNSAFTVTPRFVGGTPPAGGSTQTVTIPVDPSKWSGVSSLSGGAFWSCGFAANTITCSHTGAIASPGTLQTITWQATSINAGASNVTDTVTATIGIAPETDPNVVNNSAGVAMTIQPLTADLQLVKTRVVPAGAATVGDTVSFNLAIRNNGPAGSAGTLTVTDILPPELRDPTAIATGSGWTCVNDAGFAGNGIITCTRATSIASGVTSTIAVTTKATAAGVVVNNADVACSGGCLPDGTPGNNNGSANVTITLGGGSADLSVVSVVANPDPVQAGANLTYTITVRNNSATVTATNTVVTNSVANVVGIPTGTWSNPNAGGTSGSCTGQPNFNCAVGTLAPGESATVTLLVRPSVATPSRPDNASVYSADVGDPDTSNNINNTTSVVNADGDVQALLSSTGTLQAGTSLTYTLTARNNGPSNANGVTLTSSALPASVDFVSVSVGCVFNSGTRIVTCTPGTVNSGIDQDYALVVRPRTTGAISFSITAASNTNLGAGGVADRDSGNQVATRNDTIVPPTFDLLVNDNDAPDPVPVGQTATHTLRVTNQGPSTSSNTVITDIPPVGLTITPPVSGTVYNNTADCSGSIIKTFSCSGSATITCNVGDLDAGHSACFAVGMTTSIAGVYTNSVSVTSTETLAGQEGNTANNAVTENTTFKQPADLSLTKTVDKLNAAVGDTVVFTITVNNSGPGNATGVTVADSLPAGFSYVSNIASRGSYSNGSGVWSIGNLDLGQSGVLTVSATVNGAGSLVNTAEITASSLPDPDSTPNNHVPGEDDQANATVTRVVVPIGSIAGLVYFDANNNGAVDGGEAGIGGVQVGLSGYSFGVNGIDDGGAGDDVAIPAATYTYTDAAGLYSFGGLLPGNYTLTETQPSLYSDGFETAGSSGGTVNNSGFTSAAVNNRIANITLASGINATGYLFGERTGVPGTVAGKVWINTLIRDKAQQTGEPAASDWTVELVQGGVVKARTSTGNDGRYVFTNVTPGSGYELRFRHPRSNGLFGDPLSQDPAYTLTTLDYSARTIANLTVNAGANVVEQNLPIDPSGIVYDAVTRVPVSGAVVTISGPAGFNAATDLVGGVANQSQTTDGTGIYQFLLFPTAPAGVYTLTVNAPSTYLPAPSGLIPACTNTLIVGPVPNPSLVQASNTAPALAIPLHNPPACAGIVPGGANSTQYYFSFNLNGASANVLNNHIPLDPILGGVIAMTKITPLMNVTRGDMVPYTVTAANTLAATLSNINVVDHIPPGFRYRTGSATLNGVAREPTVNGRELVWPALTFSAGERKVWKMILVVGAGVAETIYTNNVWAMNNLASSRVSNIASAAVRVVPDPDFDCSDIIGKVFDDKNANGYQDQGELGIANVRVVTPRGLLITTDAEGRFHVTCADVPQADRGSNFVMKLDERTLPSGYRLTTENPRDVRVTRGKMAKLNFGATVHKVVRLELNGDAFAGNGTELQPQWSAQLGELIKQLHGRPSVLRVAYAQTPEKTANDLAAARLDGVVMTLKTLWQKQEDKEGKRHPLVIETELEGPK